MAQIAEKQNDTAKASEYRRQSREAYLEFQGARYQLQEHEPLIAGVIAAVVDAKVRQELESVLKEIGTDNNLLATIQRILDGERDEAVLCEQLGYEDGAIINAILRHLADLRYQLQQFEPLIARVVAAVHKGESPVIKAESDQENLAAAIRRILDGERDEKVLCEPLDYYTDGAIIHAILRRIAGEV